MKLEIILIISLLLFLGACSVKKQDIYKTTSQPLTEADRILAKAVKAHGGKKYNTAHYGFIFRKKQYTFQNDNGNYTYTAKSDKDGKEIFDVLENGKLTRTIDGKPTRLSEKQINGYSNSLNSVIYFATLPHKLQDAAVNKTYQGTTSIKEKPYHVLQISFDEENGGKDHDDIYHYWINQNTNTIDYLAYNFHVNGGGVRFRSAYNPRIVDGILFQDYINYKAAVGTPLKDLPSLLEKNELKKLSEINTEKVVNLGK